MSSLQSPPPSPRSPGESELSFFAEVADDEDDRPPEVDSVVDDVVGLVLFGSAAFCCACAVFEVISRPSRQSPPPLPPSLRQDESLAQLDVVVVAAVTFKFKSAHARQRPTDRTTHSTQACFRPSPSRGTD